MTFGVSPGIALAVGALLVVWLVIVTWLGGWLLRRIARATGWSVRSWRSIALAFATLLAAIHFGNAVVQAAEDWNAGRPLVWPPFPPAFLIGSVAIGVGIAAVRTRRR